MAERYVSALTGPEMDAALLDMAQHNSEAWAVGTRNGAAVSSSDDTYQNNSKYYADEAEAAAARAEAAVPAGTEGAVLFSQAQSLTAAQKQQVFSNVATPTQDAVAAGAMVDGALKGWQLGDLAIASKRYTANNITAAGWYRLAKIRLANVGPTQFLHCAGLIFLAGFYNSYKPSKGVFSFAYDGGGGGNIVQLGGVLGGSPTQLRLVSTAAGAADGAGYLMIDAYFSRTGTMTGNVISVEVSGANILTLQDPVAVADTATGETVRATMSLATIASGHVTTTA